jgi:alkylated DNA repair dioxygenase AlkB
MAVSTAPPVLLAQPSLLGLDEPSFDPTFAALQRTELGAGAWIDHQPGWLSGHQRVFDDLVESVAWEQHSRPMYERLVVVPRLVGSLPPGGSHHPVVAEMAEALGARYGQPFERIGLALYRNGADSVAWHGDQVARDRYQAVMATVSVGEPRPFKLRPKRGGPSRCLRLGHGDLLVMGGTCQRTWDHAVPKLARAGPRIVIMFRPCWMI